MVFEVIYYTENDADESYRMIEGATLRAAIDKLVSILREEGTHGAFRIETVIETKASFAARRAKATV